MDHDGSGNNNFLKKQTNKAWCTCQAGVLVIHTLTRENDLIYTIVFCYCCRWCRGQLSTKLKKNYKLEPLTFTCCFSFSFWRVHWFCLGDSQLAQVNNSLRANEFPAGEARKVTPGLPQDTPKITPEIPDGFDLYSSQSSFTWPRVDSARRLSACWIRFASWESFIGFYIWS